MGFDPSFERPACLATLKSSDRTKQSVCGWQYIYVCIYQPLCTDRMWQKVTLKRNFIGLNSEFSFETGCLTTAKEPYLTYFLPIAGERIIGFIPLPRVLALCEMQPASSRIWTRLKFFFFFLYVCTNVSKCFATNRMWREVHFCSLNPEFFCS